jgi:plastocyanin
MTGRFLRCIAALAAVFAVLPIAPAGAKDTTVTIKDNYFTTPYILVTVGNEVTWVNSGSSRHTVVAYPDSPRTFDSSPNTSNGNCTPLLGSADCLEPGDGFSQVLRKAGTYRYYCKVAGHADPSIEPDPQIRNGREQPCGMCGIVVVTKKPKPPSPAADPARSS